MPQTISREQARRFLLKKHGLIGESPFVGKSGVLRYVRQVGCVQYDPVDVCGKSHELAFLARVRGFTPQMLWNLLYRDRLLLDYWDKNMSILPTEDWPYLEPVREKYRKDSRSRKEVDAVAEEIRAYLHKNGPTSSQGLPLDGRVDWYWSESSLSRVALETLYFRGDLIVHHKRHTVKSYALAEDFLPAGLLQQENPCKTLLDRQSWQALRRIGAVGMLWNKASDAWLGMEDFKTPARNAVFERLEREGKIMPVCVEGISQPLYVQTADLPLLAACEKPGALRKQVRFLPPLDCLMWDRKLILALFGFEYTWEIYTPLEKRKYSYYVLPVLYGERFAGRVEPVRDRKSGTLHIKNFWPEAGFAPTAAFRRGLGKEAERLAAFHGLAAIEWGKGL